MPRFRITDSDTGRTLVVEGEVAPTQKDAVELFVEQRRREREPLLDRLAPVVDQSIQAPGELQEGQAAAGLLAQAVLSKGGRAGDIAARVVPPLVGSIAGLATGTLVGQPMAGTSGGGAAGGAIGEGLGQLREYLRGERDEPSLGQFAAAIIAGGVPVGGRLLTTAPKVVATRAVQGAGIAGVADATGQAIDTGEVDFKRLAESGAFGALFGAGMGGLEAGATRRAVLQQIRQTPEFRSFGGTDAELVQAVRAKMAAESAPPKPAAKPEEPIDVTPAQPPAGADPAPVSPVTAEAEMVGRMRAAGMPVEPAPVVSPPVVAPVPPPAVVAPERVDLGLGMDEPSTTALPAAQHPVVEFPVERVVVNKDIPQFKGDADPTTGVVEGQKLAGKYERLGTAPVVLWEKAGGEVEIITGRHRLDLARRAGERTIPAQIVRESDGFTKDQAIIFDAESNIRDGQGAVRDYAQYFRDTGGKVSRGEAEARGLLSRRAGNSGWHLGRDATDDLYTLYANDGIAEGKAVGIARGAPGNAAAQASAIRVARQKNPLELELYARNLASLAPVEGGSEQMGFDGLSRDFASFEAEAAKVSAVQAARMAENIDRIRAVKGAITRPESARKMGLQFTDENAIRAEVARLEADNARLAAPDAELYAELRRAAEVDTPGGLHEDVAGYTSAHARWLELRSQEKQGKLSAAGQAELDQVEQMLGQDFAEFYAGTKGGALTTAAEKQAETASAMKAKAAQRLVAGGLESQVDLFGPSSDKGGQLQLFDGAVAQYLAARGVTEPRATAAARGVLAGIRERRLARQLQADLRRDEALADGLRAAGTWHLGDPGLSGSVGGVFSGGPPGLPVAGGLGGADGGIQLSALAFTNQFIQDGHVVLIGRKFRDTAEFVAAAQILRNREIETAWVLPFAADGTLLVPIAVSSRLPHTVQFEDSTRFAALIEAHLQAVGAKTWRLLHNHPSGVAEASSFDLALTPELAQNVRSAKFISHEIINHGTYASIDGAGRETRGSIPAITSQPDPSAIPQGYSPYLGRMIAGDIQVRALGYELQSPETNVALLLASASGKVNGIASLAVGDMFAPDLVAQFQAVARRSGAMFGVAFYEGRDPAVVSRLTALVEQGVLAQASFKKGGHVTILPANYSVRNWFGSKLVDSPATRFAEDTVGYEAEAPLLFREADGTVTQQPLAHLAKVPAVEMPELVQIVKQLTGDFPKLKTLPKAHGNFVAAGRGRINLDRRIFSDPVQAARTLAHEIGHLADYLPDHTMARGNILGRIATLRQFMSNTLPKVPGSSSSLTAKERAQLRRNAEKAVGKRPPKDEEADLSAWQEQVKVRYAEMLQSALEARGLVVNKARTVKNAAGEVTVSGLGSVRDELMELTFWWRPLPSTGVSEHYLAYRESPEELYADALSVLFNAPEGLKTRAPLFWDMFFSYLDRKPEVKAEFFATWDLLHQGANAVSAVRTKNLRLGFARAEEILMRKAAERSARRNSLPALLDDFKQKHYNLYAPIIDRTRAAKAAGAKPGWTEDPEYVFDAHPLAENENYRFLDRLNKQVMEPLATLGLDDSYLGEFLTFNRIANEAYQVEGVDSGRTVIANPLGHDPKTARRELLAMRYRLGPARYDALKGLATHMQDLAFEVVKRGWQNGIYSTDNYRRAAANKYNYATFAVVDFLEDSPHIPAAIRQQRGTLREVANPFLATVLKMLTANKLAEHNNAKRVALKLLVDHFPGEVEQAPVTRIPLAGGKVMTRAKPAPAGKEELVVLEDGRPLTWYVEPEMARMFDHRPPASAHAIVGLMNWTFRNLFYPAFITYNPAFQFYSNPLRDLRRSYVNLPPGVQRRRFAGEQVKAGVSARARMLNDITGAELQRRRVLRSLAARRPLAPDEKAELDHLDRRALAIEMLATRAIATPFESFAVNPLRHDVWGAMLTDYRLLPDEEKGTWLRQHAGKLGGLLDKMEAAGLVLEAMPKMAAYRVLTRDLGWHAQQAAEYVRNHVGTPNFMRRGYWAQMDGTVFPFVNVMMQGLASDLRQAQGRMLAPVGGAKQRAEWWRRMAESTLVPRLLQALAAAGVFGAGLKGLYDGVSEYQKSNFLVLPLGKTHAGDFGGQTVAVRLPEDETARVMGGLVHHIVQLAANDDPAAKASVTELLNYMGGQAPGVNPLVSLASGWSQYAAGINPRDSFRMNTVMGSTEFTAGGWPRLRGMLAWTWNETGGGNVIRWDPRAATTAELTIGSMPGINRLLLVTDAGHRERQDQLMRGFDARNAKIRSAMPPSVNRLLAEYAGLTSLKRELRTPLQDMRYAELRQWHSRVWEPNFQLMQEAKPETWSDTGRAIGDLSAAFQR